MEVRPHPGTGRGSGILLCGGGPFAHIVVARHNRASAHDAAQNSQLSPAALANLSEGSPRSRNRVRSTRTCCAGARRDARVQEAKTIVSLLWDGSGMIWRHDDLVPDQLWALVAPLLPAPPRPPYGGRHRTISDRACFAAIVFMARTGVALAAGHRGGRYRYVSRRAVAAAVRSSAPSDIRQPPAQTSRAG